MHRRWHVGCIHKKGRMDYVVTQRAGVFSQWFLKWIPNTPHQTEEDRHHYFMGRLVPCMYSDMCKFTKLHMKENSPQISLGNYCLINALVGGSCGDVFIIATLNQISGLITVLVIKRPNPHDKQTLFNAMFVLQRKAVYFHFPLILC